MNRILNIAEKPSIARAISRALSVSFGDGKLRTEPMKRKGARVFRFEYAHPDGLMEMTFTSVFGHIMELDYDEEDSRRSSTDPRVLFNVPVVEKPTRGMKTHLAELSRLSRTATEVYLWLDCDREGELIAFSLQQFLERTSRHLTGKFRRLRFSSLETSELKRAIDADYQIVDTRLSDSAAVRRLLDFRIGTAVSRLLNRLIHTGLKTKRRQSYSYGPCQFPALGIVKAQDELIERFSPQTFFTLSAFTPSFPKVSWEWKGPRISQKEHVETMAQMIEDVPLVVEDINRKTVTHQRPLPLTTIRLLKLAADHLDMNPAETLSTAQYLYERRYITYPRTETDMWNQSIQYTSSLLTELEVEPAVIDNFAIRSGSSSDEAHPPIHPVRKPGRDLQDGALALYQLIFKAFVASGMSDASNFKTVVTARCGSEVFICSGLSLGELGFRSIWTFDKQDSQLLPTFNLGQVLECVISPKEGHTRSPSSLSDSQLISRMDEASIGTDATLVQHIERVISCGYVKRERGHLSTTKLGAALHASFESVAPELIAPEQRAELECEMARVASGELSYEQVYSQQIGRVLPAIERLIKEESLFLNSVAAKLGCPPRSFQHAGLVRPEFSICSCQRRLSYAADDYNFFLRCSNMSCCKEIRIERQMCNGKPRQDGYLSLISRSVVCPRCQFEPVEHIMPYIDSSSGVSSSGRLTKIRLCPGCVSEPWRGECRHCTESSCPFAGKAKHAPVLYCACGGEMVAINFKSSCRIQCQKCTKVYLFPQYVQMIVPLLDRCPQCEQTHHDRQIHHVEMHFNLDHPQSRRSIRHSVIRGCIFHHPTLMSVRSELQQQSEVLSKQRK